MTDSREILLLRGLGREARHWMDFPRTLEQTWEGSRVQCLDLPGFGKRASEVFPLEIRAAAEILHSALPDKKNSKRILIAVSLGGMVATEWIFRHPQDFDAAIFMNTSGRGLEAFWRRLQPEAMYRFLQAALKRTPEDREREVLDLVSNHSLERQKALPIWAKLQQDSPTDLGNFSRQLAAAALWKIPKGKPRIPVLVIYSRADRMVHPRCSEVLAERWGCESLVHPTAGHDVALDDPEWVIRSIKNWSKSQGI